MVESILKALAGLPRAFLESYLESISVLLASVAAKKNFIEDCNLKVYNLLKRNSIAKLFMENILYFSKHLSSIVWSSNLAALQPRNYSNVLE